MDCVYNADGIRYDIETKSLHIKPIVIKTPVIINKSPQPTFENIEELKKLLIY